MDGVCTNFITSCIKANGLDISSVMAKWKSEHRGQFSAFTALGIKNSEFWANIDSVGETYWSEMDAYPWFVELYEKLSELGKVYFLTSPSQNPNSLSGKLKWLQKQFHKGFKDYVITPNKELLASENSYLIDDYPVNIEKFNIAGGHGILFPQFWNSVDDVEDKVAYIISAIGVFK